MLLQKAEAHRHAATENYIQKLYQLMFQAKIRVQNRGVDEVIW